MDAQQKIYAVILTLEEAAAITSQNKPLLIHCQSKYLRFISENEVAIILEKLADDEKIIQILRSPAWLYEAMPIYHGLAEHEESFQVLLTPQFQRYASDLHEKFKDYHYSELSGDFLKKPSQLETSTKAKLDDSNLSTRERSTLLKLVIGMAIKGYTYDPKQSRNSAIGDIASDLESLGISVDPDTIRKWLKEASETFSITDN